MCCWDVDYPDALRTVDPPAPLLFYKGNRTRLRTRGVAVVGTRKPTPGAIAFARRLSRDLAAAGIPVVSGLARGIDTAAHTGALGYPGGTVAVIGTGVDVPYPAENAELMVDVTRSGCVVSEQFMGMHPSPHVFPRRNRLISALSHAVVVVEGGLRSGALITARWALDQGREVGAVPGFPGDYRTQGPNHLLRQGAFVVEGISDILDAVPALGRSSVATPANPGAGVGGLEPAAAAVLALLGTTPVDSDAVASALAIDVAVAQQVLVALELDGHAARDEAGGYIRATPGAAQP
jgi:DNA processing protein